MIYLKTGILVIISWLFLFWFGRSYEDRYLRENMSLTLVAEDNYHPDGYDFKCQKFQIQGVDKLPTLVVCAHLAVRPTN